MIFSLTKPTITPTDPYQEEVKLHEYLVTPRKSSRQKLTYSDPTPDSETYRLVEDQET